MLKWLHFINPLIRKEVPMTRYAAFIALAALFTFGFGTASFAGDPVPAEQKQKKDTGTKADEDKKKDEKKDMGK
jgi:hypothetical protein